MNDKTRKYYLVYSAKTGRLLARGAYTQCADKLGYKHNGFYSVIGAHKLGMAKKYIIQCIDTRNDMVCPCYTCKYFPKSKKYVVGEVSCSCEREGCDLYQDWAVRYLAKLGKTDEEKGKRREKREFFRYL